MNKPATTTINSDPTKAPIVGIPIVDHRALQLDYWKLHRELARRPPRRYQPQPIDSWDRLVN